MRDWPFALSTGCFHKLLLVDCLPAIRESGFTLVEVCSLRNHLDYKRQKAVEEAARRLEELHMEARSFHAPFGPGLDITALNRSEREAALEELACAARAAQRLGAQYFVLHPGPERSDIPRAERLDRLDHAASGLNHLALYCRELDLRLCLETMLPHLFTGSLADLLWLLGSISSCEVDACLDTGHAFLAGDVCRAARQLAGHLSVIHAHDNQGRFDDHLPPGQGHIDWGPLLAQLGGQGFQGTIVLELADSSSHPAQGLAQARQSMAFLRRLARQQS